jgi:hypothetical protein
LDLVAMNMESTTQNFRVLQTGRPVTIKGMPGLQQTIAASVQGFKVVYLLTVVETEADFYVIYTWTMESRFAKHQALLQKVTDSFTLHQ